MKRTRFYGDVCLCYFSLVIFILKCVKLSCIFVIDFLVYFLIIQDVDIFYVK